MVKVCPEICNIRFLSHHRRPSWPIFLNSEKIFYYPQSQCLQGLADAGGDGGSSSSGGGGGGGNGRKENKSSHNGLSSQQPGPKRARTTTPTPAPKMARIESGVSPGAGVRSLLPTSPHPAPVPITRVVSPPEVEEEEEDDGGIVEVDPGDNPNIKSEAGWMMSGQGEDSSEYEIPSEQFEQDMQAEDEQYIQAGNDSLSGQQVGTRIQTLNTVLLLITKLGFVIEFYRHSFWQTRLFENCQIQSS